MQSLNHKKSCFFLIYFTVYFLPVLSVKTNVLAMRHMFTYFSIGFIIMAGLTVILKIPRRDLGFRTDTLKKSIIVNILLTVIVCGTVMIFRYEKIIQHPHIPAWNLFFIFYLFFSGPAQEFLYRSLPFALMERAGIKHPALLIILSTVAYTFLHIIFSKGWLILPGSFVMGLIWGTLYYFNRNIIGISLSHGLIGAFLIIAGLI